MDKLLINVYYLSYPNTQPVILIPSHHHNFPSFNDRGDMWYYWNHLDIIDVITDRNLLHCIISIIDGYAQNHVQGGQEVMLREGTAK